jgi:ABC-type sugar transport system ATPase subunit
VYLDMVDANLDLDMPVEFLGPGERQLVEIAKALRQKPRLLILDEPTTSLTSPERARLFEVMRGLKKSGIGIVFITHFINEVYEVCDKIVVLRNGIHVGGGRVSEVGRKKVEELMVGHTIEERTLDIGTPRGDVALAVRDFESDRFVGINFEVHHGEILGIAGLMGAGRTELIESIFGLRKTRGTIVLDDRVYRNWNAKMMKNLGVLFIPEDRRTSGIFPTRDVKENISIAALKRFLKRLIPGLGFKGERKGVQAVVSELRIQCSGVDDPITSLSGGNQQKTIVGRWISIQPKICMFDDPTRGVDIGAKDEISRLIAQLAREGNAVVLVSSDINELILLSHRMIIMRKGRFVAELDRNKFNAKEIIAIAATSD